MRGHVAPDAVAKSIFAEKTFEHKQKRLAFAVGDVVKGAVRLRLVRDRLLDRVSCRSCIAFHGQFLGDAGAPRRIARNIVLQPDFPLRIETRGAFRSHPGGKTFVEPEIVPPRHGHEIAKPLMRGLVRDHFVNALPRRGGRFLGIEKQRRFVVSNASPVFHRAAESAGNGDLIELGQRIRNAEVVVVIFENLRRAFERVTPPLGLAFCGDDANMRAGRLRFDQIQLAGDENIQVTRHRRRWCEAHFFSVVDLCFGLDRHVRNGQPVFRNDGGELKSRAETWFVPTREKAPRVGRFELRAERDLFRARALLLIAHVIKPAPLLIDFSRKTKRERVRSGRKLG